MSKLRATVLLGLFTGFVFLFGFGISAQEPGVNHVPPVFRVTVVGRTTAAINYRPRSGSTKVDLVATGLLPGARGVAEVSGKKGLIEIDARFENMGAPTRLGAEYLTYVLWAITPEGRATNLGEVQLDEDAARIKTTTELQAFGLIVTAEPYFAVTQPSDVVVMENLVRRNTKGKVETIEAKYELLQRGSYLMNRSADFNVKPLEPGAPLDLAEARTAIELARIAGADRYAADAFAKATRLLADAERARGERKRGNEVMMPARQAVQTAEDARLIAVKRRENEVVGQQLSVAAQREQDALERAKSEEARRQQAELEAQIAAAAKTEGDRERLILERAHREALAAQAEAQEARATAEAAKKAADAEVQEERLNGLRLRAAVAVAEQEKNALREQLRERLNDILETRETARGLIMDVPDVLFATGSATLTSPAREKLARVAGILASHPDLHVSAQGHTDNVGNVEDNLRLSERRVAAVLAYLVEEKVPLTAVDTVAFGESDPVASNDTSAGRKQNRRVELLVTGESIGRADNDAPR
jgi:outer membrane protein OmpA-like peptidoglycan-associated protein